MTENLQPIFTAHLFTKIEQHLLDLLRSLAPEEWEAQTIVPAWKVKDVAAHLLDTQLRKLSLARDGYFSPTSIFAPGENLAAFINRLNHEGVAVYRRLSPAVLISLLEITSRQFCAYHESLDPFAQAAFAVSWAGEKNSLNWFDTAREFTERWHHQEQIRFAANKPGIMTREFYFPVLDTFMRALPYHYRDVFAPSETLLQFIIEGDCGGSWYLQREENLWRLIRQSDTNPIAKISIPQALAWRIFTKGIDRQSATSQIEIDGNEMLGLHIITMLAIVA